MGRESLRIAGHGEIRTVCKWLLTEKSCRRIVYGDQNAATMSLRDEFRQVTNIESRVTRCFQPQKRCAIKLLSLCIACGWSRANLYAIDGEISLGEHSNRVVAIGR